MKKQKIQDPINNDAENSKIHIRKKRGVRYEQTFPLTPNTPMEDVDVDTLEKFVPIPISMKRKRSLNGDEYYRDDIEGISKGRPTEGNEENAIAKENDRALNTGSFKDDGFLIVP